VLQSSGNLLDWTPLNTNLATADTFEFTDQAAADHAWRFYRFLEEP
jgi:hypothetical protein